LAFIAPTAGRVDIAIALAPFLIVHRHQVTIAPFLAVELPSRRPSPSIRHRAVHCRPLPLCSRSIAAALGPAPSLIVKEPSHRPLPLRSRRAVHCR
jgi:hypothetical protein